MIKQDILELIDNFERETWKYEESDELYNDMEYIYRIQKDIEKNCELDLDFVSKKLLPLIGLIRYKYGFEHVIISSIPDLVKLNETIKSITLDSEDILNQYHNVSTTYMNYIKDIKNLDFIKNNYDNVHGHEGLCLALESLKSLVTNDQYRKLLIDYDINSILVDCIKLNKGIGTITKYETKYEKVIKKIWEQSLSNCIPDDGDFRILFSNIRGVNLFDDAIHLLSRKYQSSCSMISSKFIATYSSKNRRIGFMYPSSSTIIDASAYDLCSNVFGFGAVNDEKGTTLLTPDILERFGIKRTKEKNEDLYFSNCYNEVLVDSKPCAIVIIGFGENDLNVDYEDAIELSNQLQIPLYHIDIMKYKNKLTEVDKEYIAHHSILSFLGLSESDMYQLVLNYEAQEIYNMIEEYKEDISKIFISLKKDGILNKTNMCQCLNSILDVSIKNNIRR